MRPDVVHGHPGHGRSGGCDAGWHHRERHFPHLGFRVWHWLFLLFIYVLLRTHFDADYDASQNLKN